MVLLVALASAIASAADNAAVTPQAVASRQSPVANRAVAVTIPQMLSYQGKLTDTLGVPVANGSYPMMFLLYTTPTGGSPFWSETQSVATKSGLFSVLLGSVAPIESVPSAGTVYLAMTVSGGPELTPRIRIGSAAFAYLSGRSASSDLLQGKDTTGFVRTGQASSVTSNMVVDGTLAAVDLGQMGASGGQVMKWNGSAWVPANDSVGQSSGGTVRKVVQATGVVCSPNPIADSGTVRFDSTWGDARFVNEAQSAGGDLTGTYPGPTIATGAVTTAKIAANAVDSTKIADGSVTGADIKDGTVSSADIRDTTVNTAELKDAAVTMAKLSQSGASSGQAIVWNGSAWAPAAPNAGNADMVDGYHAGNSSGQVAVSNGTVCTTLNADLLDGSSSSAFAPASGSANYIQNQFASNQTASWRIAGQGRCSSAVSNDAALRGISTASQGVGVRGYGPGTGYGVAGYSDTTTTTGMGVIGRAYNTAIFGKSEYNKGVYGYALDDDGVYGYAYGTSLYYYAGVNGQGHGDSTYGVKGSASGYPGVYGTNASYKHAAVEGRNTTTSVGSAGVAGYGDTTSVAAYGVYGLARYYGVYGRSKYYQGVRGEADQDNGISGYYSGTNSSYAGVYGGRASYGYGVYYSGGLSGSGTKNCIMRTSRGPTALYCQESPENWFEDFGSGTLVNGHTHVNLDALFLETVTVDQDHGIKVFLQQTSGDPVNLVVQKGTTGFDVNGPPGSNVSFDYRVVAKRRGFENARLDVVSIGYNDPYLYPDPNDPEIPASIRAKRLEAARLAAMNNGAGPQPRPSNPTTIQKIDPTGMTPQGSPTGR